jgi:hypothetical protein
MNPRVSRSILTYVVRPPILLLGLVLKPIEPLLGLLDRTLAKRNEAKLRRGVTEAMPFLFEKRRGRIVANEEVSSGSDCGVVTVEVEGMFIRFSMWRGELGVYIGCIPQPRGLNELGFVLSVLDEHNAHQAIANLDQAALAIESNIEILIRAFGNDMDEKLARRFGWNAVNERIANREAERDAKRREDT